MVKMMKDDLSTYEVRKLGKNEKIGSFDCGYIKVFLGWTSHSTGEKANNLPRKFRFHPIFAQIIPNSFWTHRRIGSQFWRWLESHGNAHTQRITFRYRLLLHGKCCLYSKHVFQLHHIEIPEIWLFVAFPAHNFQLCYIQNDCYWTIDATYGAKNLWNWCSKIVNER